DGLYDLRVVATDLVGNSAPSATVANRRVDNTAPDTSITTQPSDPSNNTTPSFSFTSSESGSTFECRIDGGSWPPYSSPDTLLPGLTDPPYTPLRRPRRSLRPARCRDRPRRKLGAFRDCREPARRQHGTRHVDHDAAERSFEQHHTRLLVQLERDRLQLRVQD